MAEHRFHHLDGLRGIATIAVMIHHSVVGFDAAIYSGRASHSRFTGDQMLSAYPLTTAAYGDLAVCVFFVLSGFVLARSFSRTRLGLFALVAKRYVRLGLPILSVVLIAWALQASGLTANGEAAHTTRSPWLALQGASPPSFSQALIDGFYGAMLLGNSAFDSSLWTMPIEFLGSMVLILTFAGCRLLPGSETQRHRWCGWLLLLFAAALHGSFMALFGLGAAAYLFDLRRHIEPAGRKPFAAAVLVILGLILGTMPFSVARPEFISWLIENAPIRYTLPWRRMEPETFWHATGAVMVLIAIDTNPALRGWFSGARLQFLGRISFPLYLVHVPILTSAGCLVYLWLLRAELNIVAATALSILVCHAVSVATATLLTWTVERASIEGSAIVAGFVQAWNEKIRGRLHSIIRTA